MPEEFREYRRRERPTRSRKNNPQNIFGIKILKQLIISIVIFVAVFGFSFVPPINPYIKKILTHRVDTSGITETLGKLINLTINTKEGHTNENSEASQNP